MKKLFTLLLFTLLFVSAKSQTPQLNWAKAFNGKSASTDSTSVMKMSVLDNSIYIAGTSDAYGKANDIVLIKRDYATGDTLWTRHYNGPANADDQAVDMVINQSTGDVYVTGKSTGLSTGYDVVTLKYSSTGVLGWAKRWDNASHGDDIPKSIGIDFDGRVFVSATTFNGNSYLEDLLVLRYDNAGNFSNDISNFMYDPYSYPRNNYRDFSCGAKVSNEGKVYVAGEILFGDTSFGWSAVYVYAMSSSFYESYTASCTGHTYDTSLHYKAFPNYVSTPDDFNYFNTMDLDNSNNVYLAYLNDTIQGVGNGYRICISKVNSSGCQVWEKNYGKSPNAKNIGIKSIKVDSNGNVYAAGYEKNTSDNFDWFVIKYNSSGVFQWRATKRGTGNGNDIPNDLTFDNLQNPVVVGVTKNTGTNNDITFVKYNKTNGAELFSVNYDSANGDEKAYNIIVDSSQKIIINGIVNTTNQSQNMITLRYCNPPSSSGVIAGTTNICQGQNAVTYIVPEIDNATSYIWTLPTGATGSSTTNTISVSYSSTAISGNITVKGRNDCSDGASSTLPIVVNQKPSTPAVTINGNALHSSSSTGNQWCNQTGVINGATAQEYTPKTSGDYYVIVSSNGCISNSSNTMHFIPTGINPIVAQSIRIYPNPVTNELTIELEGDETQTVFEIINSLGKSVFTGQILDKSVIQTSNFASGIYIIKLESGNTFEFKKIIKK